jgi:hypothetical protein
MTLVGKSGPECQVKKLGRTPIETGKKQRTEITAGDNPLRYPNDYCAGELETTKLKADELTEPFKSVELRSMNRT